MTDSYSAADIAAILENFREQERQAALFENRRQKVMFARNLGSGGQLICQTSLEAVIDQTATSDEIYDMIARFDDAIDRHKAKLDLNELYAKLDAQIRQLDVALRGRAQREVSYRAENAVKNAGRRVPITFTSAQEADLRNSALGIAEARKEIAATWELVDACKKIMLDGMAFDHVETELRNRLATLTRTPEAA